MKQLAPYAKHLPCERRNLWIYSGPRAWILARWRVKSDLPVLVLPPGRDPSEFQWPVRGQAVMLIERGECDTSRIERTALELLRQGAPFVSTIREALGNSGTYYYRETPDVAA